jgi:hypothetical protein
VIFFPFRDEGFCFQRLNNLGAVPLSRERLF